MRKIPPILFSPFSRAEFTARGGYLDIWRIAWPLIIMSASHTVMQFVDRKFLAQNATIDMAAAFPAGILYFTLFCFYFATANFANALTAQFYGAGEKRNMLRAFSSGLVLTGFFSLLILFLNPWIGHRFICAVTKNQELLVRELEYFDSLLFSGVFVCMSAPFFAFFSGQGKTMPAAVINMTACLLNILLDYWLIFGVPKLGIPACGIWGAGIATTLCTLFSLIAIVVYFFCQDQNLYPTRKLLKPSVQYIGKILRYGAPSGFQVFSDVGSFTLISFLFELVSPEALAASVIALAINNIFFMPLTGLSDAVSIVVGGAIGGRRFGSATKSAYRGWRIALLYMLLGGVLYLGFPELLIRMFAPDNAGIVDFQETAHICRYILIAAMTYNFLDATKFVLGGALRGAGDTLAVMLINIFVEWLLVVPVVLLLTTLIHSSIYSVWWALTGCGIVESLLLFLRFRSGAWKKIDLLQRNNRL